jgi:hypothetical protein
VSRALAGITPVKSLERRAAIRHSLRVTIATLQRSVRKDFFGGKSQ